MAYDYCTLRNLVAELRQRLARKTICRTSVVDDVLELGFAREEQILRMRFGIGERSDFTLEEVGQDFFVTRERIRQIEAKALRKLRHPSRCKKLKSFMDP